MAVAVEAEFDLEIPTPTPVAVEDCAIAGVMEHAAITEATTNGFMDVPNDVEWNPRPFGRPFGVAR
jgi:hypothetical protein